MIYISIDNFAGVPVSTISAILMIIIFSLYFTTAIKTLPCGKDIMSVFASNFTHIEPYHLLANLYAVYALSRIEKEIGWKKFLPLIGFILVVNTVLELILYKLFPGIPCSIGFSGVLFAILVWDIVREKSIDMYLLFSIILVVIVSSLKNTNVSLSGHLIGVFTGLITGMLYSKI